VRAESLTDAAVLMPERKMQSSSALLSRRPRTAAVRRHAVEALVRREYGADRSAAIVGKAGYVKSRVMRAAATNTKAWRASRLAITWLGRVVIMWGSYRQVARELYGLNDRDLRDLRVTPGDITDIAWSEARLRAAESERPLEIGAATLLALVVAAALVIMLALIASHP